MFIDRARCFDFKFHDFNSQLPENIVIEFKLSICLVFCLFCMKMLKMLQQQKPTTRRSSIVLDEFSRVFRFLIRQLKSKAIHNRHYLDGRSEFLCIPQTFYFSHYRTLGHIALGLQAPNGINTNEGPFEYKKVNSLKKLKMCTHIFQLWTKGENSFYDLLILLLLHLYLLSLFLFFVLYLLLCSCLNIETQSKYQALHKFQRLTSFKK